MADCSVTNTYDVPIKNASEDRLERGPFATLIANALLADNPYGASVIGLTGKWGTGKSSVATMVVERINDEATVVNFEPWMVGSREALVMEFFTTLGKAVLPSGDSQEEKQARSRFYQYGSKIVGVLATGAKAVGTIVPGAVVAGKAAESVADVLSLAAQGLEAQFESPSLREVRDTISSDLGELTKAVIIVIDDIDRLDQEEVRTIFQLIKACADFPNLRYLLLFDREQVLHALEGSVNNPDAFLEKIVNQVFDLPEATTKQRANILDEALSALQIHEGLSRQDMDRLRMLFDEVLLPGLPTVRHVKRFVTIVRSLLPGVIVDGFRNIDPADFLALEFLRQHVPSIYSILRDEEAPPPGGRVMRMVHYKEWPQMMKDRRDKGVEELAEPIKTLAIEALESLYKTSETSAVRARRFNTEFWKPVYLGFHEGRAGVSERVWSHFLKQLAHPEENQHWLADWSDRAKREKWVVAITSRALDIPWPESLNLLVILFEWGEQQYQEASDPFNANSWELSVRFCVDGIMSVTPDELDPVSEFCKVVKQSNSVVTAGYCIGTEIDLKRNRSSPHWVGECDIEPAIQLLHSRLTSMLYDDSIWDCRDVRTAKAAAYYTLGNKIYDIWWNSIPENESRLIKYLERDLGEAETFNYGFEEGPLIEAIRNIDLSKLTPKAQAARLLALSAVGKGFISRDFRRRPKDD
ncbi:MAG: hypothetical protein KF784_15880 [Fimbriimonadaceae bacterium]|nr:hypothetical protein [Fimbriimonadaceae bacterium]